MSSYRFHRQEPSATRQPNLPGTEDSCLLGAQLESALLRELQRLHHDLNASHFQGQLASPVLALSNSTSFQGRWLSRIRTIELSRRLVLDHAWGEVVEVIKHEMAHQFVDEVLHKTDETAHGPAFRQVCETVGIDPRASAPWSSTNQATDRSERVLQTVARLLALADSPNEHEAQAAMSAAQRLMLKYNLEDIAASIRQPRRYGFRQVGRPSGRVSESEHILGAILAEHFFVDVIWVPVYRPLDGRRASVLEVCGTPANLEMAAYVHAFLTHTADQLWLQHKKANDVRSNRDRRTFLAGVMTGFRDKLGQQRKAQQQEGLVWVRDGDLDGYYRKRHPYIRHTRISGNARTEAHQQGREAGRNIVLHRPMESGSSGGVRLLPEHGGKDR